MLRAKYINEIKLLQNTIKKENINKIVHRQQQHREREGER